MTLFAALYKLDSKGKVRMWTIDSNNPPGTYKVSHGEEGGKMQTTIVKVKQKNVGKVNETSLVDQADLEAESKWQKQVDKGYRTTNGFLSKTELDDKLTRAKEYLPMLAKDFRDYSHKIIYPCFYQPKLDGIRCISYISPYSDVVLLSRKGKEFTMLNHLKEPIFKILEKWGRDWALDGELYSHGMSFDDITSIVRKSKTVDERAEKLGYIVYDCFQIGTARPYEFRKNQLEQMIKDAPISIVQGLRTGTITCAEDVPVELKHAEDAGYEGIMLRNKLGLYENDRRSSHLQKVKSFQDAEFEIVGCKEGIGKFEGMAVFTCITKEDKSFDVMPMGTAEYRRHLYDIRTSLYGKMLTVKFFEYTKDGIPRFPVGTGIRDYE